MVLRRQYEMHASTSLRLLSVLFKLLKGTNCFKFLKRRIPSETVRLLHRIVSLRCKMVCLRVEISFLSKCIFVRRYPRPVLLLLRRNKLKPSAANLKRVASAHLETAQTRLVELLETHARLLPVVEDLSLCCRIVFTNFCKSTLDRTRRNRSARLENSLMNNQEEEPIARDPSKYVMNLSNVQLDALQLEALSLGLDYKVPPKTLNGLFIEAQFENFFDQFKELQPTSPDKHIWFRNKLTDIAHEVKTMPINEKCAITARHFQALRELRAKDVVVMKPDKGSGVVIMNKTEYNEKMCVILNDASKFERLTKVGDITNVEMRIIRHLELLLLHRVIDLDTFNSLKPSGSTIPQLYGSPKTHKCEVPLRPILSMMNAPQHKLARWLVKLLAPLKQQFNPYSLKDSFQLIDDLDELNLSDKVICSLDVESLFTNVPLHQTVDYVCELAENGGCSLPIPTELLRESLLLCTENVDFHFRNTPYRQIDGVAMGSPLGPVLADFFMLMVERSISTEIAQVPYYKRYVDDILAFCSSEQQLTHLVERLNGAHANLRVTCEIEQNNCLPYLDILITRREDGLIKRSIYRKSTWSGQYLHFTSFTPVRYKRTLVKTLVSRARRICSADCLDDELVFITATLMANGYPRRFIEKHSQPRGPKDLVHTAAKKKVYIELPFKGDLATLKTTKRIISATQGSYYAAQVVVINRTRNLPIPPTKEAQPIGANSHCVYQFVCDCGKSYIGRTNRTLTSRIKEHVPRWVQREVAQIAYPRQIPCSRRPPASSIGKHLLDSGHQLELGSAFKVVLRHTNPRFLRFAEAVAISRIKPALCVQKQLFVSLKLPWT
ncbi:unnamed protein product [Dicrocoelium dendriticum]|nr:unnamed protein product [Dicrocoelium dendriticum]